MAIETEAHVRFLIDHTMPKAIMEAEFLDVTKQDVCLQVAIKAVLTGWWKDITAMQGCRTAAAQQCMKALSQVQSELSVMLEGLLLHGFRIVALQ